MEIYYYDVNGEKVGPFTKEGLELRIDTGLIVESTRLVVNGKNYIAGQLSSLSPLFENRKYGGQQQAGLEGVYSYTENNTKKDEPLTKKINQLENFILNERSENRSHSKRGEKSSHVKKSRGFLLFFLTGGAILVLAVLVLLLAFKNNLFHIAQKTHQVHATNNGIEDSHNESQKQEIPPPTEGEVFTFYGKKLPISQPFFGICLGETIEGLIERMESQGNFIIGIEHDEKKGRGNSQYTFADAVSPDKPFDMISVDVAQERVMGFCLHWKIDNSVKAYDIFLKEFKNKYEYLGSKGNTIVFLDSAGLNKTGVHLLTAISATEIGLVISYWNQDMCNIYNDMQ